MMIASVLVVLEASSVVLAVRKGENREESREYQSPD